MAIQKPKKSTVSRRVAEVVVLDYSIPNDVSILCASMGPITTKKKEKPSSFPSNINFVSMKKDPTTQRRIGSGGFFNGFGVFTRFNYMFLQQILLFYQILGIMPKTDPDLGGGPVG